MPGVQTLLPLMLNHVAEGRLTLERLVDLTASGPQRLFGLTGKGRIAMGYDADFSIVDLKSRWTIEESWLASRCGWSHFTGMRITGRPVGTIIRGNRVSWDGQLADQAAGEPIPVAAPIRAKEAGGAPHTTGDRKSVMKGKRGPAKVKH